MITEDPTPHVYVPRCVSLVDAIHWIAHKNLAGWSLGPTLLDVVYDHEDDEADAAFRERFAFQLVLDHARRGLVRLYAVEHNEGEGERVEPTRLYPGREIQLAPDFLKDAAVDTEDYDENNEWPVFSNSRTYESYSGIAVDYEDLTRYFWGKKEVDTNSIPLAEALIAAREAEVNKLRATAEACQTGLAALSLAATRPMSLAGSEKNSTRPLLRHLSRRGRPKKYKWAELTAATVELCLTQSFRLQEDLVRQMLDWCSEHWGAEPAISDVREYVAPIFQTFEASWKAAQPAPTENSEPKPAA